ncbi:MAG: hypothetical protein J6W96_05945, partial [Alphaproteobacteria bacterium]|nr:hypothetical protein [Alphaproteobacteria bacterium]
IGAIDVSVAILPLLHSSYVINKFVVKDAVINLEENAKGSANWVFETPQVAGKSSKEEKTSFKFELIKSANAQEAVEVQNTNNMDVFNKLTIRRIVLDNVKINYTDKTNKTQSYDIKNVALDENKDGNIDFDFNVNDGLYQGTGTVGSLKLLSAETGYPVKADVNVMGIGVVADATLFDVLGNLRFDGNVKAKGFLGKDSQYDESADITAKGDLKKIDAVINSIKIAGNVVNGSVNAQLSEKVPSITANLRSDKINLASFAAKETKGSWGISLVKDAHATSMVPATPIPYEALSQVNVDADINIAQIVNNRATVAENVVANVKVSKGVANLKITNGTISQGSMKANVSLSAADKTLNLDADLAKVNLLKLMQAFDAQTDTFRFINGSDTDMYVNLKGKGNTYAAITDSLDGRVVMIVDKSKLHIGNIGIIKGNIFSQIWDILSLTKNDDLNMECAVVRADVKNGVANFPSGIVVNADKFTVVASGDINLKNDKIDLGVKPFGGKLTDVNVAKMMASLVKINGTIKEPYPTVDTANVVKNVVGATMTGPVYLGAQMAMEADNSPCYTALKETGYETRFPKSYNIVKSATDDVGKAIDGSVDIVKDTAKGLLNMLSGKSDKAKNGK